jgi:flagellar biosynthesis protein FlhF
MAAESLEAWGGELLDQLKKTARHSIKTLPEERAGQKLVALIGPTGSGKTSSLMRLAHLFAKKGKKVALISLDTLKLGASEQLSRFARISGLGLKVCQTKEEFKEARELFEGADRVLVDTSTRDMLSPKGGLSGLLSEAGAYFLLCLPASMKDEDLSAAWKAAEGPFLLGAVLTKLDETKNLGNVISFAKLIGPIFAYFKAGSKSPEDFSPADPERLVSLWLRNVEGRL